MKKAVLFKTILLASFTCLGQTSLKQEATFDFVNFIAQYEYSPIQKQFLSTTDFLDAAINSINSFNSLLKKEAYRIK